MTSAESTRHHWCELFLIVTSTNTGWLASSCNNKGAGWCHLLNAFGKQYIQVVVIVPPPPQSLVHSGAQTIQIFRHQLHAIFCKPNKHYIEEQYLMPATRQPLSRFQTHIHTVSEDAEPLHPPKPNYHCIYVNQESTKHHHEDPNQSREYSPNGVHRGSGTED